MTTVYTFKNSFYTGTPNQPDNLSFFIKNQQNDPALIAHTCPVVNGTGKSLFIVGSFAGVGRICMCANKIFQKIRNPSNPDLDSYWNIFKNLFRGLAEMIPGSGLFLMLYDTKHVQVKLGAHITHELNDLQNIAGIAIDGKITTLDLAKLKAYLNLQGNDEIEHLLSFKADFIMELLQKDLMNNPHETIQSIFEAFKTQVENATEQAAA